MSIATRINAIEEHIGNAYNKLEDLGIDLTGVDKNIENIAEMLDTVYEDYPKVTGTGTEISLEGTKVGKLSLDIKGNSTQDGTPAPNNEVPIYSAGDNINLFTGENTIENRRISTSNGSPYNSNGYTISDYTEVTENINYLLTSGITSYYSWYNSSKTFISGGTWASGTSKTAPANAKYVRFDFETTNINNVKFLTGVGSISEKITNKNLFNIEQYPLTLNRALDTTTGNFYQTSSGNYYGVLNYIPFSQFVSKTLAINSTLIVAFYDKDKNYIGYIKTITPDKTVPNGTAFIRLECGKDYINEIQIEIGSTATDYVAHQEQTYTIPVQQPMRSIGTVRDEFIQVNGNWFERHNIARYICKGNEVLLNQTVLETVSRWIIQMTGAKSGSALSNYYTYYANYTASTEHFYVSNNQILTFHDRTITSGSQYLQYFAEKYANGNPVYFDYQLATPVDLPCTSEQIAILENLPKSYNEQTNIYSIDVTPAYFDASALKA